MPTDNNNDTAQGFINVQDPNLLVDDPNLSVAQLQDVLTQMQANAAKIQAIIDARNATSTQNMV